MNVSCSSSISIERRPISFKNVSHLTTSDSTLFDRGNEAFGFADFRDFRFGNVSVLRIDFGFMFLGAEARFGQWIKFSVEKSEKSVRNESEIASRSKLDSDDTFLFNNGGSAARSRLSMTTPSRQIIGSSQSRYVDFPRSHSENIFLPETFLPDPDFFISSKNSLLAE